MEQAIGSKIDDYLIEPVNPNQILSASKKLIDNKGLVNICAFVISKNLNNCHGYQFSRLWSLGGYLQKVIHWEIKLDDSNNAQMTEILDMQKKEANKEFSKYVINNYQNWVKNDKGPVRSNDLLRQFVIGSISETQPTVFFLLDNLRYDQWKVLEPIISELYKIESEDYFCLF